MAVILHLKRGSNHEGTNLVLPATPADVGQAYARLDNVSRYPGKVRIDAATCSVRSLENYLKGIDIDKPGILSKLNRLGEKIGELTARERKIFSGALDGESINGLDDILHVASHLDDYTILEDVGSDRSLGEFMIGLGLFDECPEELRPYLDTVAIGAEAYSNCGGAYTLDGYVLRKKSATFLPYEDYGLGGEHMVFKLRLQTRSGVSADLILPASEEQLDQALRRLRIDEFAQAEIEIVDAIPYAKELIPSQCISIEEANDLAMGIEEMQQRDGELLKFFSALEVEQPETFTEAYQIALNLDDYERVPEDMDEYGRMVLRRSGMDDELMDMIDGYMDFAGLGEFYVEENVVRKTDFGMVRRCSAPFEPEQQTLQMGGM